MKSDQVLPLPNPGDWLTAAQAAAIIGVGKSTMYDLMNAGKIHSYRIGSIRAFWKPEIQSYAEAYHAVKGRP